MIVHRAEVVLPIARPPLRNGWVAIDRGRVAGCGTDPSGPPDRIAQSPFAGEPFVILPALVNAHTHVELSYLRGRVPRRDRFDDWIRDLVAVRRTSSDSPAIEDAAREAIREARATGTGLMGDVGNTLITIPLFREAGIAAHVFHELLGFNLPDPEGRVRAAREQLNAIDDRDSGVRVSLAPHAPYSVAPALFRALQRDIDAHADTVSTVHVGESRDEIEFLKDGSGAIRAALDAFGAWNPEWIPPGVGPIEYIARFGLLHRRMLLVHAVQLTDRELADVRTAGATIVTCPRSNQWTGAGIAPIRRFYESGVHVAIGTDSLTSVDDLNMFSELAAVRALAPTVPARSILESATLHGAAALGFGDFGTIEPGKRAALIAVRLPPGESDVEEYLLSGITPADVRWLEEN